MSSPGSKRSWQGSVVVYLVNRTTQDVNFPFNGGAPPPLLREAKGQDGRWHPAARQPLVCVDLPEPLRIGPGLFILLLGSWAEKGEEREIRYRQRELSLVSNAGKGLVDPEGGQAPGPG